MGIWSFEHIHVLSPIQIQILSPLLSTYTSFPCAGWPAASCSPQSTSLLTRNTQRTHAHHLTAQRRRRHARRRRRSKARASAVGRHGRRPPGRHGLRPLEQGAADRSGEAWEDAAGEARAEAAGVARAKAAVGMARTRRPRSPLEMAKPGRGHGAGQASLLRGGRRQVARTKGRRQEGRTKRRRTEGQLQGWRTARRRDGGVLRRRCT